MAKTTKLTVNFPMIMSFVDYHEIRQTASHMIQMFDQIVESDEVGFDIYNMYWGVFYVGRKPAKAVINKLLVDAGFKPEPDEGEE
ncbi:hypothetical protein LCGC14_2018210 [marine sediment metagenome]|uniref:Uncharacterized protein n=1 Tax=marine sediment metagenome TaxID=412755 RepID=A0A0F9HBM5_9ZZZZ